MAESRTPISKQVTVDLSDIIESGGLEGYLDIIEGLIVPSTDCGWLEEMSTELVGTKDRAVILQVSAVQVTIDEF